MTIVSPEAVAGPDRIEPRSDLYGVGAVGYFLLLTAGWLVNAVFYVFNGLPQLFGCIHDFRIAHFFEF